MALLFTIIGLLIGFVPDETTETFLHPATTGGCSQQSRTNFRGVGALELRMAATKSIPQLSEKKIYEFWGKVASEGKTKDDCWEWKCGRFTNGYGMFSVLGKPFKAHRIAWFIFTKQQPNDLVLHTCDNPPCCNPNHLFEGSHSDNMDDRTAKGRVPTGANSGLRKHPECACRGEKWHQTHTPKRGINNPAAKLTPQQVAEIRKLALLGEEQQKDIAARFGIVQSTVSAIKRGAIWV